MGKALGGDLDLIEGSAICLANGPSMEPMLLLGPSIPAINRMWETDGLLEVIDECLSGSAKLGAVVQVSPA